MSDKLPSNYYFDNDKVEKLLMKYHERGCTDVSLRNEIMSHADELITNVIRTHNLHNIYIGKDDSSFNDLYQIAWTQIESTLYKFNSSPGHPKVFNLWCMAPDTMLITDSGIRELGDVSLGLKHQVYGLDGMNSVEAGLIKPKTDVLQIQTQYNYKVTCTPEHQLLILKNDIIDFTEASKIENGDLVALQFNQQCFGNHDDISDITLESAGDWKYQPTELDEELSYILGLFIAEGSYTRNTVTLYNIDNDTIDKLQNNKLGLRYHYYKDQQAIMMHNKRFVELLKKLGFNKERAYAKYIPPRILSMSRKNIISLLSGMFDGDGGSSRHNGNVTYTTTSQKLMNQTRMLLLNLGMISKLTVDNRKVSYFHRRGKDYVSKKRRCYQLTLSTIDSKKFYDTIGFGIGRKQEKSHNLPTDRLFINGVSNQFQKLRDKYGLCGESYATIRPLRQDKPQRELAKVVEGLKIYSAFRDDPDYKFVSDIVNEATRPRDNIMWLRVNKITKSKSKVCEISVNSKTHSYIANGIVSHNSQVARTVILAAIKKDSRDRKNSESYRHYLDEQVVKRPAQLDRFLKEAREVCKYCEEFMNLIGVLEDLYFNDSKPHEGLIGKMTKSSGLSRAKIIKFIKMLRLMSFEFTDSPVGEMHHQEPPVKPSSIAFTKDDE